MVDLQTVLQLIVGNHRRVCHMTDDQQLIVDELNQIHARLDTIAANMRVHEVVSSLRLL